MHPAFAFILAASLICGKLDDSAPWKSEPPQDITWSTSLAGSTNVPKDFCLNSIIFTHVLVTEWADEEREGMSLGLILARNNDVRLGIGLGAAEPRNGHLDRWNEFTMPWFIEHRSGLGVTAVMGAEPKVFVGWRLYTLKH